MELRVVVVRAVNGRDLIRRAVGKRRHTKCEYLKSDGMSWTHGYNALLRRPLTSGLIGWRFGWGIAVTVVVGQCDGDLGRIPPRPPPFLHSSEGRPRGARLLNNARSSYSRPLARKRPPRIGRYETRRDVFNCPTWRVRRGATMDVKPMRAKNSAHFNRKGSAPLSSSLCSQSFCQTLPVHHCIPSNRPLGSLTNVPVAGGVGQRRPLHPSA